MKTVVKHFSSLSARELYDILRLRAEVFVVEQNCPYQDLDGRDLDAWHVCLYNDGGDIVATSRVFMLDRVNAQIGRVVTSLSVRGTGVGAMLMRESVRVSAEHFPGAPIVIHAQSYATGFYARFGFRISSGQFLEDGIPHNEMTLDAGLGQEFSK